MDTQFYSLETILRDFYADVVAALPHFEPVVDAIMTALAEENNQ